MTDSQLLADYVRAQDQRAFAELVRRHLNLVYSAALRRTHDSHLADDVTQAVFVILARKAPSLTGVTVLSAWLHKTTRYAAMDALKLRGRRDKHERKAAEMRPGSYDPEMEMKWPKVAEILDLAVDALSDADRRAVLLRFYENKSFAEVGAELGVAEDAARKRVSRATEKLRAWLARRGAVTGASLLTAMLSTRLAEASAPPTLAAAMAHEAAWLAPTGPAEALANQTLHTLSAAAAKTWLAYTAAAAVACVLMALAVYAYLNRDPAAPPPPAAPSRVVEPLTRPG